ncbi:unnamed protein product [Fraxinus pennsylvanica]|uniref:Amino acid transporter transmembrane domain-containing protein n=1 Tax=Fraxinus pennsylvanica TaxID=56036 RepID=A0AAD2EC00_9LAMI|nr:unnamed protein product [Fraxinus pennsylvanica]
MFNLSTTIVGAGIMALPATSKVLGLFVRIAMIVFMAFLTEASIELLLRYSRTAKLVSYAECLYKLVSYGGCFRKVMCFLEPLQVEFIMLVFLKLGLDSTGGMGNSRINVVVE